MARVKKVKTVEVSQSVTPVLTLESVAKMVAQFLARVNGWEGRVAVVLNVYPRRAFVDYVICGDSGLLQCGLTSAARGSKPETVAARLLADLS